MNFDIFTPTATEVVKTLNSILLAAKAKLPKRSMGLIVMYSSTLQTLLSAGMSSTKGSSSQATLYDQTFKMLDKINSLTLSACGSRITHGAPLFNALLIKDTAIFATMPAGLRDVLVGIIDNIICPESFNPKSKWYREDLSTRIALRMNESSCDTARRDNLMAEFHIPRGHREAIDKHGNWAEFCSLDTPHSLMAGYNRDSGPHCLSLGPWPDTQAFYAGLREDDRTLILLKPTDAIEALEEKYDTLLEKARGLFSGTSLPVAKVYRSYAMLYQKKGNFTKASEFAERAVTSAPHDERLKALYAKLKSEPAKRSVGS